MPPVLLGYEPQGMTTHFGGMTMSSKGFTSGPSAASFLNNKGTGTGAVSFQNQTNAFVTIFITLQPAVQPSITIKVFLQSKDVFSCLKMDLILGR
jgi:hypothetical protein